MKPFVIETNGQLGDFLQQEWLLTNGTGAFAASTILGCNTRRYHSLLCAATLPPVGRIATVNRIGEILHLEGRPEMLETSLNQFPQRLHPRGDRFLRRFELDDSARFEFDVAGVVVRKEVLLLAGRNVTAVRYQIQPGGRRVRLELLPFVALRDFHSLRRGKSLLEVERDPAGCCVRDGGNRVHLKCDQGRFVPEEQWWFDHVLPVETERGLDDREDLYVPGRWVMDLAHPATVLVAISTDPIDAIDFEHELARRRQRSTVLAGASETVQQLLRAADDFVVERRRPDGSPGVTVIAGYPWFADWGRDTMISLPGLLLCPRRFREAAAVLEVFAEYVSEGMIPNRFNDYTNEPEYNTVDASLWFIHACFEYLRSSGDEATFYRSLLPACRSVIEGYRRGTRFGIAMDASDGLITQGDASTQLTWMD
ncbi:MAG: glycogen debranching enzyme N-terminal domain-containing protein, partial [Phycisphaerales bacterium]|nr:glycogen debranching enzyme N-terminal domain-containing protein [Phycisphaerales bacterium]